MLISGGKYECIKSKDKENYCFTDCGNYCKL